MSEELYKLANHVASSKNGLPTEWQYWADEIESDLRKQYELSKQIIEALNAAMEWIDAVPSDTKLPTMPGFDRDWVDNVRKGYID